MSAVELYGFQADAIEQLRAGIRAGRRRQILSAPTGSGKTECAIHLLAECHAKGKRGIFLCDRISLVDQTSARLDKYGIPHGVIQANHWRWQPYQNIQVASAQTLARRTWPNPDLVIVDEAHTVYGSVKAKVLSSEWVAVGLSATPFTKGLGRIYEGVVSVTTTNALIEQGYLAPFDVFAASEPDMTGAKVTAGEWHEDEAAARSMPIVGDCVREYLKHGHNRKFIAFGCTVAHCEELERQFLAAGVPTSLYTYRNGDEERSAALTEFRKPDSYIRGLISVSALAKGFDVEDIGVVIIARPLRSSLTEHIQMLGRGLRKDPNNPTKRCIVLDHAGNSVRFWGPMSEFFQDGVSTLDDGSKKPKNKATPAEAAGRKCPTCHHVHAYRPTCPKCGHEYPTKRHVHEAGELVHLGNGNAATKVDKQRFYGELLTFAAARCYKPGWVANQYKARFGVWPRGLIEEPKAVSAETYRWVQSRQIRYAKGRARTERHARV